MAEQHRCKVGTYRSRQSMYSQLRSPTDASPDATRAIHTTQANEEEVTMALSRAASSRHRRTEAVVVDERMMGRRFWNSHARVTVLRVNLLLSTRIRIAPVHPCEVSAVSGCRCEIRPVSGKCTLPIGTVTIPLFPRAFTFKRACSLVIR